MIALRRPQHNGSTPRGTQRNLGPKWPNPCWFVRWRHSITNCGRMVTDSAMVTMESLLETTIALSNNTIADPLRPPFPQKWGPICPHDTRMAISPQRVIRYTSCLFLWWGFHGRRIEWRYFGLYQIQDDGQPPSWKILNGCISAKGHAIHFIFAIAQHSFHVQQDGAPAHALWAP